MSEEKCNVGHSAPAVGVKRLVVLLRHRPRMTCTEIGETLWGGKKNRQAYARPAGKLVAIARRQGLVIEAPGKRKAGDARRYQLKHNAQSAGSAAQNLTNSQDAKS